MAKFLKDLKSCIITKVFKKLEKLYNYQSFSIFVTGMKEMIIGVDVDLTVVDTLTEWLNWYERETGHKIKSFEGLSWNINRLMVNHKDPMSFWRQGDLYDGLKPLKNSVEVLEKLSQNHQVVFVSHCEPEHEFSKRKFLDKYFSLS